MKTYDYTNPEKSSLIAYVLCKLRGHTSTMVISRIDDSDPYHVKSSIESARCGECQRPLYLKEYRD